ncbi:MAG: hypothetical protein M2R45_03649 [Verrucomicrobia subdivision 3 bacterium]|nr:hypothetical protein [Limisphaerales bacterium]MCS1412721.1 hypothetical protein [Limisphaerales bacterium]
MFCFFDLRGEASLGFCRFHDLLAGGWIYPRRRLGVEPLRGGLTGFGRPPPASSCKRAARRLIRRLFPCRREGSWTWRLWNGSRALDLAARHSIPPREPPGGGGVAGEFALGGPPQASHLPGLKQSPRIRLTTPAASRIAPTKALGGRILEAPDWCG